MADLQEMGLRALGAAHVLSWGRGAGSNVGLGEKTVTKGTAAGGALISRVDNELSSPGQWASEGPPWETSWRQIGCGL